MSFKFFLGCGYSYSPYGDILKGVITEDVFGGPNTYSQGIWKTRD